MVAQPVETSGVMRRTVYSWAVFAGGRPLCTQILPGHCRPPSTILGVRKPDTRLPEGEDRIHLRSLVLTQHRNVTYGHTRGPRQKQYCAPLLRWHAQ